MMAAIVLLPIAALAGVGILALILDTVRDVKARHVQQAQVRLDVARHRASRGDSDTQRLVMLPPDGGAGRWDPTRRAS